MSIDLRRSGANEFAIGRGAQRYGFAGTSRAVVAPTPGRLGRLTSVDADRV
jgi:hypothetical protein